MANMFQENGLIVQLALAAASLLFIGTGVALSDVSALKQYMRSTFPEDGQPYRHYAYRRSVGIAYVVVGICVALSIFLDFFDNVDALFPFWGLTTVCANSVLATSVVLTLLYASCSALRIMLLEVLVLIVLVVAFLLAPSNSEIQDIIRSVWAAAAGLFVVGNAVVYVRTRQRYLRTMFGLIGDEAMDFLQRYVTCIYIPSVVLNLLVLTSHFVSNEWRQSALIVILAAYYVVLGLYYRSQSMDSAVVEETMEKEFDWKHSSDELWRKTIRDND